MEELPKLLNKKEAYYTPRVLSNLHHTCVVEIKYTDGPTLPVSKIREHQIAALRNVQSGKVFKYKIPDMGQRNPFDAVILHEVPAYLVIIFEGGKYLGFVNPDKIPAKGSLSKKDCFSILEKW